MDAYRTLLLILASIFLTANCWANSSDELEQSYSHYRDSDHAYDLHTISSAANYIWSPLDTRIPNYSFSDAAHWIKIELRNTTGAPYQGFISVKTPHQDYLSALLVREDGTRTQIKTGDRTPFKSRIQDHRHFHFELALNDNETTTFYLQAKTHDGLFEALPIEILPEEQWHRSTRMDSFVFGLYFGAAFILLLYNLILFTVTREKLFFLYSVYLTAFIAWNITFTGFAFQYLWPNAPHWNNIFLPISIILSFASLSLLSSYFLDIKNSSPMLFKALVVMNSLQIFPLLLAILDSYATAFAFIVPVSTVTSVIIMTVATKQALKGLRSAQIFLAAWAVLVISIFVYLAQIMDIIPATSIAAQALNVGSIIEFLILAIALADRFNRGQQHYLEEQTELAQSHSRRSKKLMEIVNERTEQLDMANAQIANMAATDPLTGLYNRRYFAKQIEIILTDTIHQGDFFCILLLDLDYFKAFNDRYGHAAGDRALIHFSRVFKKHFEGTTDQVFRVGGEEFAVLFSDKDVNSIQSKIGSLRFAMSEVEIQLPEEQTGRVGFSGGAAIVPSNSSKPGSSLVFRLADESLYEAKALGRSETVIRLMNKRDANKSTKLQETVL
ncbi:sensor domain-containing diguanylate cyclase [Echinimonas agarilytica]|uniref:diguanylate cyclase n=1 Tax=Echinimonas agarilytica TaxID=1215918 RepID=A0AA42B7P9_9GAMM|nr:diguanylate cyclase [Echinimonas agarilytica]MCM2679914.1 sensor domain-containing diguanylate cyclase [Echinimonas agarilytica]